MRDLEQVYEAAHEGFFLLRAPRGSEVASPEGLAHEYAVREVAIAVLEDAADEIQLLHPGEQKNSVDWLRNRARKMRPQGFHVDPDGSSRERWWTGQQWTETYRG